MNDTSGATVPGRGAGERDTSVELHVLLACFGERKGAAEGHARLDRLIAQGDCEILDQVVVRVNSRRAARVSDPRRTLAGSLTAALTWGVFGFLAGGLQGLGVWAVMGAVCGGLYASLFEHLLSKNDLARVGRSLPADSSAILAFIRGSDPQTILSVVASFHPTTASVAAVTSSLSARVHRRSRRDHDATSSAGDRTAADRASTNLRVPKSDDLTGSVLVRPGGDDELASGRLSVRGHRVHREVRERKRRGFRTRRASGR